MRFNPALAAAFLILGALVPAHAETEMLPADAPAAGQVDLASATGCATPNLPPINQVYFPSQDPGLSQLPLPTVPPTTTPAQQAPAPACP